MSRSKRTKNNFTTADSLFRSTLILTVSNVIVKGLGFFYRVVLVRLLGTEGVGLWEMTMPLFSFLLVLGGCGVQTALSQMIASGRHKESCFSTALLLLLVTGSGMMFLSYLISPLLLEHFAADARIRDCFLLLLPALPVIGIASAFRGFFQGHQRIEKLGMSQNTEQLVRVAAGIMLVLAMAGSAPERQVTATSIATVCGETAGLICLLAAYCRQNGGFRKQKTGKRFDRKTAAALLAMCFPLTGGRLVSSGVLLLQAFLIPLCLQKSGIDTRTATQLYGSFSGVALSLLHLPGVFSAALTTAVLPSVAESINQTDQGELLRRRCNTALAACSVFTLLGMMLLFLFADQLCSLLFHDPQAALLLRLLVPGGLFFYLTATLSGILQGLGAVRELLFNSIVSGIVLVAGILLLTSLPVMGIAGSALAVDICWVSSFLLNLFSLMLRTGILPDWKRIFGVPALACGTALVSFAALMLCCPFLQQNADPASLAVQGITLIGVYFLILWKFGAIPKARHR